MSDTTYASTANDTFRQFRAKLNELFQMDRAELDFGIYRIMNVKRAEITRYLDDDLFPQVEEILADAVSTDTKAVQEELATLEASLKDAGVDPATSPKVQDLRARLANTASQDELRQRAFSHLLTFFSRYYDKGDFISKRRYKDGTYMIPYNGEEVKLVWANMDQYYIKTSEYLRDYRFFLNAEKTLRMTFKLVEGDTERDNIKGKNRIFRILEDEPSGSPEPVTVADDGLVARFEYVLSDTKQKAATEAAIATILERSDRFRVYLEQKDDKSGKTLLEKHLSSYTARNSEDYFIHKDLGGFLKRELDFFLKNEVLRIDDMLGDGGDGGEGMQAQLHLTRAIKEVGGKIIAMLAQIEEFQKKLWLKRKMVTSTNYLVTIDKIIEKAPELLPQIAGNEAQREEWVRLFAIDEITADAGNLPGMGGVAHTEPLTEEFLRANDKLLVDTRFFDREFVATLLARFEDIDAETDGLLVHSENFQALNLLQDRYDNVLSAAYLDPPYNTDAGPISYKNGYRSASWISLLVDRLEILRGLVSSDAIVCVTIDDYQARELEFILDDQFGRENQLGIVPIRNNPSGRSTVSGFSVAHEYALFYRKSEEGKVRRLPRTDQQLNRFTVEEGEYVAWKNFRKDGGASTHRAERPKQYYPIYVSNSDQTIRVPKLSWKKHDRQWDILEPPRDYETVVYPIDDRGNERVWSLNHISAIENMGDLRVVVRGDSTQILRRHTPQDGILPRTWWDKKEYAAREHGTAALKRLFGSAEGFAFAKSPVAVKDSIWVAGLESKSSAIIDFFAGSGTTGHAVIHLNREDGGSRKYILVEMGEYFDTVLKPRIAKVVYSTDWKDGKPQSRDTGVSHLVKYIRLESYEDTLNNLIVPEQGEYSSLLEQGVEREFREGYLLGYMLDWEAGAARITTDRFAHPFDSVLNVAGDTVGERKPVAVDLVETFNYLIGLTVRSYYEVEGCRIVEGSDPAGDHVLVVWRDLDTTDNAALDDLFLKQRINIRDREFDLIYVNGDNNLENIRRDDETWKVRLIEHEFTARMFTDG